MTLRRSAPLVAAILPFAAALAYTLAFGVDVPRHDEWNLIPGISRAFEGTLTADDFWTPANVHIAVFPRLAMVPLAVLTGWDLRIQLLVSFAFMTVAFAVLAWRLARDPAVPPFAVPLASAFVFSLHAVDTWLWACQLHVSMAVFGAVSALVLLTAPGVRLRAVLGAAVLGTVASWSFLSGFVVWPAGAVVLALRPFESRRARTHALAVWSAGAVVALAAWFATAVRAAGGSRLDASPVRILDYTARYLGTGLLGSEAAPALLATAGWIGLAAFAVGAWVAVRRSRSPAALVLLAIGAFGLATGPMIAIGRLQFGVERASSTRYASFSSLAWIAILLLPWLVADLPGRALRFARAAIVILAVAALAVTQAADVRAGRDMAAGRREAAVALRKGEGISDQVLAAAATRELLVPMLADRLATLRRWKISIFRDATEEELRPAPWRGEIRSSIALADRDGGASGRVEASGGVPGNAAYALLIHQGALNLEGIGAFGQDGRTAIALELAWKPEPADTFHVLSVDREGRVIQSVPSPIR